MNPFPKLIAWVAKNERPLGAALFSFGFLTDLFTFGLLPVSVVNVFFITYLVLAAVATFGTHLISVFRERDVWWRKLLSVLFPLAAQYALGGLLSGFVVFYAKSSVVSVSWPFLLLLVAVYGGNEYFRKHKEHIVFQTVLFFFALYAYAIFALPLITHALGPWVFLGSTLAAGVVFGLFLYLLKMVNAPRYKESRPPILAWCAGILLAVTASYFTGLIPPIPLFLSHAEVYHALSHDAGGYEVKTNAVKPWWNPLPRVVPHVSGTPLYVFTSVTAPIKFSTKETHLWEYYQEGSGWEVRNRVSFSITGGRAGGYRGYSLTENPVAGKWRVTILSGSQVVGRLHFTVQNAVSVPLQDVQTL